ncbi:BQ2448_1649 [Microbotryum intermedium]|uniref:BQ2448_1649 protein n=1 Tax=Microbotryum intermedium TaxID=269621 RepID=A0A238FAM1_9BASI|nr:BQ2448_1649 [Microbotryum intermedium]
MDISPRNPTAISPLDTVPPSSSSSSSLQPNLSSSLPPQELILLCGLIGSGKSTLSASLVQLLPPTSTRRQWVRVNQDELGDRRTCEAIARSALASGNNVLIDRQNFDRAQRKVWVQLAREFRGVRVGAWVMGTSLEVSFLSCSLGWVIRLMWTSHVADQDCKSRLIYRQDHPTIKDAQLGIRLLNQFLKQWQEPQLSEGFDRLMILPPLPLSNSMTSQLFESLLSQLWSTTSNTALRQLANNGRFGPAPIASPRNNNPSPYKATPGKGQMNLDSFGFARTTPPPPPPFRG